MRAGKLRTQVTFEEETTIKDDGGGGGSVGWGNPISNVPCYFVSQGGREQIEAGRIEDSVTARLECRSKAVAGVKASWSALINGERWNIKSVVKIGQRNARTDMVIERGSSV